MINGNICEFNALTCIDPVTNLVEIIRINEKTAQHVRDQFENVWLSRYPKPNRCVHDNGNEFIAMEFQNLLYQFGIKNVPTNKRTPTANSICERMHQTVGDILRVVSHTNPPQNMNDAQQVMDNVLATCMHATRCAVNASMETSPGALVYNRDMLLDIPLVANLELIQERRQQLVDDNLRRQNARRVDYKWKVGN